MGETIGDLRFVGKGEEERVTCGDPRMSSVEQWITQLLLILSNHMGENN